MSFEFLTPYAIQTAVEQRFDLRLDGTHTPYNSYVNRVYGLKDEQGRSYVAKFYRPGRWTPEALEEEHSFLKDCGSAELTVALPFPDPDGETLGEVEIAGPQGSTTFFFALFEKKAGRNFDAESEDDWLRLGRLIGRLHDVGRKRQAWHRPFCSPETTTAHQVRELLEAKLVHPDLQAEFSAICGHALKALSGRFGTVPIQRIHGDCHRGNILDRGPEGLLLMDFDDMMSGPAVQDLWLLLPGYREDCGRELALLSEGYEEFSDFDPRWWDLVEPLRFMRMVHFLAWTARQRHDPGFARTFPDWGSRAFWTKEIEDLRTQAQKLTD